MTTQTTDCRVTGCFFKRGESRAGSLPCEQGFGGSPELAEATFRNCAKRIEAAYEVIHQAELDRRVFK